MHYTTSSKQTREAGSELANTHSARLGVVGRETLLFPEVGDAEDISG